MQGSRSLFQTAIKINGPPPRGNPRKSRPFLNVWRNEQETFNPSDQPEQKKRLSMMASATSASSFYDFTPLDSKGKPYPLSAFKGKVVLVVNVASKCGFTPQYTALETVYKSFSDSPAGEDSTATAASSPSPNSDFTTLGFPCNQFGGQEPGSDEDIQQFCTLNYGVSFPVLAKVDVNGDNEDPLWGWMKKEKPGLMGMKRIKWNFEKFLIGRDGQVKGRWASTTKPESIKDAIEAELKKGGETKA
ncbi:MAG: hypothetical protein M1837_005157 [Sclerophora amabilis]|nr:MAG: hypothetical protein M1837_005157 [Sclerophora amabilis]